jgi:hypothetical protein
MVTAIPTVQAVAAVVDLAAAPEQQRLPQPQRRQRRHLCMVVII